MLPSFLVLFRARVDLAAARSSLCIAEASVRDALQRTRQSWEDVDDVIKALEHAYPA